jgi:uncharacterized protein (TIGR02594 family)
MPEMTLRYGSTGTGVLRLQQLLNSSLQNRPPLRTDGFYGPQTEGAVRLYQSSVGLKVDGVTGPETWRALEKRLVKPERSHVSKSFPHAPWLRVAIRAVEGVTEDTEDMHQESVHLFTEGAVDPPTGVHVSKSPSIRNSGPETANAPWMREAMREFGQEETPGPAANPRILEYNATTTLRAQSDETPWCSSFVNWCMQQVGIAGTKSAAAISWMHWGSPCTPIPGAITIICNHKAAGSSLTASGYHVGFLIDEVPSYIRLLGGNQSNQVKYSNFSKANWRLVGYRWPHP